MHTKSKSRIYAVVPFNPNWVGPMGLMSNFPFGLPLTSFGIDAPHNAGMGTYLAKRTFGGRRPDDVVPLRFKISIDNATGYVQVLQELPHNSVADISPMKVTIHHGSLDNVGQMQSEWTPFIRHSGIQWRRTAQVRLVKYPMKDDEVPVNLEGVLGETLVLLHDVNEECFDNELDLDTFDSLWGMTGCNGDCPTASEMKVHWGFYQSASQEVITEWRTLRDFIIGVRQAGIPASGLGGVTFTGAENDVHLRDEYVAHIERLSCRVAELGMTCLQENLKRYPQLFEHSASIPAGQPVEVHLPNDFHIAGGVIE